MESILCQSFTDYEIILVDDDSPDECPALCDEYAQKDSRIKVIHKTNGGLSDARNAGIEMAQGDYITFVDSDDDIGIDTLEPLIVEELMKHPQVDILEYPVLERIGHPTKESTLSFTPHEYDDAMEYWLKEKGYQHTYAWNKIYKRNLFRNIRFPKGKNFEDALTIPKLIGLDTEKAPPHPIRIKVTNLGCYHYHWNEEGITAKAKYSDLRNLYIAHTQVLDSLFLRMEEQQKMLSRYGTYLQDYMLQILNVLLDLYELSGNFEPKPSLIEHTKRTRSIMHIKSLKLKLLLILGYHNLCKINKVIHKIYRHHY